MRLYRILCPKCKTALTSKAGIPEGQALKCPKCHGAFKAAPPADEATGDFDVVDDDFEVVDDDPPPESKKPAKAKRSADDDDEEAPRARKRARKDDDDEENEEEDEKPRKRKKREEKGAYGKLKSNVWVRVITLVVLLAVLGVLVYLFIEKKRKDREAEEFNKGVTTEESDMSKPIRPDPGKGRGPAKP